MFFPLISWLVIYQGVSFRMKHKLRGMVLLCALLSAFSQSDGLTEQEAAKIKDALMGLFHVTYSLDIPSGSEVDEDLRPVVFTADSLVDKERTIRINIAKEDLDSMKIILSHWLRS